VRRVNLSSGDDFATDAVLMPDGKVVLSLFAGENGSRDFTLARFTSAGDLDLAFNGSGTLSVSLGLADDVVRHLALDDAGRIVAAGSSSETTYQSGADFAIVRFNADGTSDRTFGRNGAVKADFYAGDDSIDGAVLVQPDGNIVAIGVAVSGTVPKLGMIRAPSTGVQGPS
jgi:uncharacterized delta-60 repeat protein